MPTKRHPLPHSRLLFEIVWEPGSLGGAAHAVVDALRLINRIAALGDPMAPAPVRWRWVRSDGSPVAAPALAQMPPLERAGTFPGRLPRAYRGLADVMVVPGWMTRDGPEIDQWVGRCSALVPRLQQTLAQGGALLGVFTGVTLLAAAGCLHGRRFAAPWPFFVSVMRHASASGGSATGAAGWSEAPDWTSDRGVWTCASPVAATEAVLDLMGTTALADLARAARDVLLPAPLRQAVTVAYAQSAGPGLGRTRAPDGSVERARQWLVKHLTEPYDLRALADAAATSPRTLARHFAATHGMSPHQYLERLRVERACQLLQTTHVPVEEIGRSAGLASPSTFRRLFLKHTGHLPADYRRRYRLRTLRPRWGSEAVAATDVTAAPAAARAGGSRRRPRRSIDRAVLRPKRARSRGLPRHHRRIAAW
jgi:transcriptional regulator GlxA family with amidase domain